MSVPAKFFLFLAVLLGLAASALWIQGGRPVQLRAETRIMAGPETVFEWLIDPEKRSRWVSGIQRASITEKDKSGKPAKYLTLCEADGRQSEIVELVQQYDQGKFFSLRSDSAGVRRMQVFRLAQKGNSVRVEYESIETARKFGKILFAMTAARDVSELRADLETLRRLVEKERETPFLFGEPAPPIRKSGETPDSGDQAAPPELQNADENDLPPAELPGDGQGQFGSRPIPADRLLVPPYSAAAGGWFSGGAGVIAIDGTA